MLNIVMEGTAGSGKTSIVRRLVHNIFDSSHKKTEGIYYERFDLDMAPEMQITDHDGTNSFVYQTADIILFVLDVTQHPQSQEQIDGIFQRIKQHLKNNVSIILVANQADLVVDDEERERSINAMEATIKANLGTDTRFEFVATCCVSAKTRENFESFEKVLLKTASNIKVNLERMKKVEEESEEKQDAVFDDFEQSMQFNNFAQSPRSYHKLVKRDTSFFGKLGSLFNDVEGLDIIDKAKSLFDKSSVSMTLHEQLISLFTDYYSNRFFRLHMGRHMIEEAEVLVNYLQHFAPQQTNKQVLEKLEKEQKTCQGIKKPSKLPLGGEIPFDENGSYNRRLQFAITLVSDAIRSEEQSQSRAPRPSHIEEKS